MKSPRRKTAPRLSPEDRGLVEGLLGAYREGYFPMAEPGRRSIRWYNPDPRALIPLEPGALRIPRSLRQRVRSGRFEVRSDTAFERVMRECAAPRPDEPRSWINADIVRAYTLLHRAGHAHSVEAWLAGGQVGAKEEQLVGGLYGVHIGAAFMGESMFCRPDLGGTDASKVCLVHLVEHLRRRGFVLLDTQFINDHIARFGAVEVPRAVYLERLAEATAIEAEWGPFEPAPA